ncbi:hypothetical protein BV898_15519 [Hypsibius exemplaris]|uniref:G-protein coupled receptors family 1 profile domain-containing protein n=1 Tax=Hypsibius exemplaris TaxID=2072580 RepID=A0A9X6NB70_HYPEX|nr:hypothetical protein BV898_15519 [Hypsibius exemplaris]
MAWNIVLNGSFVVVSTSANRTSSPLNQTQFFAQYYTDFILSTVFGTLMCIFTFGSNLICLLAICLYPKLKRQRGNILVANLSVVTMLNSGTVLPISMASTLHRQYYDDLPEHFCDYSTYYYSTLHAFVWCECFIAFNRFVAIVFPYRYKIVASNKGIIASILLGYAIPILINASAFIVSPHMYVNALPFGSCRIDSKNSSIYPTFQSVTGVYLPLCVNGLLYLVVFAVVWARKFRLRHDTIVPFIVIRSPRPGSSTRVQSKRMRLARMLFASFIWNLLMFLPLPIMNNLVGDAYTQYPRLFFVIKYVTLLGAAGNTIIYGALNCDYLDGMLAVVRCNPRKIKPILNGSGIDS